MNEIERQAERQLATAERLGIISRRRHGQTQFSDTGDNPNGQSFSDEPISDDRVDEIVNLQLRGGHEQHAGLDADPAAYGFNIADGENLTEKQVEAAVADMLRGGDSAGDDGMSDAEADRIADEILGGRHHG